jgi:ankyrin repeat protein
MSASSDSNSTEGNFWSTFDGENFSNNLFTDLGPLLSLFGEQVTTQFMTQSLTWADSLLFAIGPLGVITGIVGAIRVGGPHWLKALIGRARETRSDVEKELMTSTSAEVCEMWNGMSLVRVPGESRVVELALVFDRRGKRRHRTLTNSDSDSDWETDTSYPESHHIPDSISHLAVPDSSGSSSSFDTTFSSDESNMTDEESDSYSSSLSEEDSEDFESDQVSEWTVQDLGIYKRDAWARIFAIKDPALVAATNGVDSDEYTADSANDPEKGSPDEPETSPEPKDQAGSSKSIVSSPNISLNYSKSHNSVELASFAILGLLLQAAGLTLVGLITYHWKFTNDGTAVDTSGYPLLVSGTVVLTLGLIMCSSIIQGGSRQTRIRLRPDDNRSEIRLFWLQKKGVVGDQQFGSYAIFAADARHVFFDSERVESSATMQDTLSLRAIGIGIVTVCATLLTISGYVVQFIALRQLHWFAAVIQLVICLIMAAVRAWVRRGFSQQPRTEPLPEDHELDWLATRPGFYRKLPGEQDGSSNNHSLWDPKVNHRRRIRELWKSLLRLSRRAKSESAWSKASHSIEWLILSTDDPDRTTPADDLSVASDEGDHALSPPKARFVFTTRHYLQRHLGSHWDTSETPACKAATALAKAIDGCLNILTDTTLFKTRHSLKPQSSGQYEWSVTVDNEQVIFRSTWNSQESSWRTDATELEAAISLWMYSLTYGKGRGNKPPHADAVSGCRLHWQDGAALWVVRTWLTDRSSNISSSIIEEPHIRQPENRIVGFATQCGKDDDGDSFWLRVFDPGTTLLGVNRTRHLSTVFRHAAKGEQALAQGCAWHLFITFFSTVSSEIVRIQGETSVKVQGDPYASLQDEESEFQLANDSVQKLVDAAIAPALCGSNLAQFTVLSILLSQDKLPNIDCIVEAVVKQTLKLEENQDWLRAARVYSNLIQTAREAQSRMFLTLLLKSVAASAEFIQVLRHAGNVYQSMGLDERFIDVRKAQRLVRNAIAKVNEATRARLQDHYTFQRQRRDLEDLSLIEHDNPLNQNDPGKLTRLFKRLGVGKFADDSPRPGNHLNPNDRGKRRRLLKELGDGKFVGHFPSPESIFTVVMSNQEKFRFSPESASRQDIFGWTPLHYYALWMDADYIYDGSQPYTIRAIPEKLVGTNKQNLVGDTPLHIAARTNNPRLVDRLLQQNAYIDQKNRAGNTALHMAAGLRDQRPLIVMLCERGASINARNNYGLTPLHEACRMGNFVNADDLLDLKADSRARDKRGFTALHYLCAQSINHDGGRDVINRLRASGASFRDQDPTFGRTPLHHAARSGYLVAVETLLDQVQGDERLRWIQTKDSNGAHAPALAAGHGRLKVLQYLLKAIGEVVGLERMSQELDDIHDMIIQAAASGNRRVLQFILSTTRRNDFITWPSVSRNLLQCAGSREVAELLISRGADPFVVGQDPRTIDRVEGFGRWQHVANLPIFSVTNFGAFDVILRQYAERDDDLLPTDEHSGTVLHRLASIFHSESEEDDRFLQEIFSRPQISQIVNAISNGETPLHTAVKRQPCSSRLIRCLLDHNASTTIKNLRGRTPLQEAIVRDRLEAVTILLACDVQPTFGDAKAAVLSGNDAALKQILKYLDANSTDSRGRTILHHAVVQYAELNTMQVLIEHGADYNRPDDDGKTGFDLIPGILGQTLKQLLEIIIEDMYVIFQAFS